MGLVLGGYMVVIMGRGFSIRGTHPQSGFHYPDNRLQKPPLHDPHNCHNILPPTNYHQQCEMKLRTVQFHLIAVNSCSLIFSKKSAGVKYKI